MPSKSAEYKQKCITDWEWMRDNCSDQGYYICGAKRKLRRKRTNDAYTKHRYCWACAYVDTLGDEETIRCKHQCPVVSWSENGDISVKGCMHAHSYYAKIKQIENLQKHHFQSVIDIIKKNWIIEE